MIQQVVLNGLSAGLTYVLLASGLSMIYSVSRILNLLHGEFYMLSGFVVFYLYQVAGINYFFVLVISMVLMGGLGLIVERFLFRRFIGGNVIPVLVIGLGMIMAIPAAVQIAFGPREKPIGSVFQDTLKLFGAYISYERLLIIVMSVVIMIGLMLFVKWTKLGMAFRAMAQNREGATLQGIDFSICSMLSMGIACALAGAAGALMAPVYSADPIGGGHITFMSLLVVAVGGMGSLPGAILAGLLLGFAESFGFTYIGGWTVAIEFLLVIFVMLVRPGGLLGVPHEL